MGRREAAVATRRHRRGRFGAVVAVVAVLANVCATHAWAQNGKAAVDLSGRNYEYVVRRGDTLIGLTESLLDDPADWTIVQRLNGVPIPRHLQPGKRILIPWDLLRGQDTTAVAEAVSGRVTTPNGTLAAGGRVGPAAWVQTDPDSVVTLRLSDGSTLRLAPSSRLRIDRLRQYHDERIVEARMRLEQGRIDTTAAGPRKKPLDIRTPAAVAAVRGTQYRVSFNGRRANTEVLEGAVAWQAVDAPASSPAEARVEAGYGAAAVSGQGLLPTEPLLDAPSLAGVPARVESLEPAFAFPPVPGARGYRVEVARDAQFASLLADFTTDQPQVRFTTRADGSHFMRVRPISANGVEGRDATVTLDVHARPLPPVPAAPRSGAVVFERQLAMNWQPAADAGGYRIQLAGDAGFERPLVDRPVAGTSTEVDLNPVGDAPVQDRWWRVATVDGATGRAGPYGPPQRLQWRAVPLPPSVAERSFDGATLALPGPVADRSVVEVSADAAFAGARRFEATGATLRVGDLAPGTWYVRRRTVGGDRVESPWSAVLRLELPPFLSTVDQQPVRAGDGRVIETYPAK